MSGRSRGREPAAGGRGAVWSTLQRARERGPGRALRTLLTVNQTRGFDCPGCAWPDPDDRSRVEFCENGAKAVVHEATRKRIGAEFFARHSVAELAMQTDHWLEAQGRLTEPLVLRPGATHYAPISWEHAFSTVA